VKIKERKKKERKQNLVLIVIPHRDMLPGHGSGVEQVCGIGTKKSRCPNKAGAGAYY
jgi:hypothetical protein